MTGPPAEPGVSGCLGHSGLSGKAQVVTESGPAAPPQSPLLRALVSYQDAGGSLRALATQRGNPGEKTGRRGPLHCVGGTSF